MLAGTQHALHQTLEQHFEPSEIGEVYCLGRCYENSAFHYKGLNYSGSAATQLSQLKSGAVTTIEDHYRVGSIGAGLLTTNSPSAETCLQTLVKLLESDRDALLEEITTSGLRGRGGAGFPPRRSNWQASKKKSPTINTLSAMLTRATRGLFRIGICWSNARILLISAWPSVAISAGHKRV